MRSGTEASGIRRSYQLTDAAIEDSLTVRIDGTEIGRGPATWDYDPLTWFITFAHDATPPAGAEVQARYIVDPAAPGIVPY